jgi:Na+-transporting NADH:ubiquinone oxidoreductase subunit A
MATHKITKGLDLPISGRPVQVIREEASVGRVAVLADDFPGMKPRMHVEEGQTVQRGQLLFEDRNSGGVRFTAPGAGRIIGIHRGARRVLQSVVIDLSDAERAGSVGDAEIASFESYSGKPSDQLTRDEICGLLAESGLWTALRTRPFSKVPAVDSVPAALFVTAIDTAPLAPLPEVVLEGRMDDFDRGLALLSKLTEGPTYLCMREHSDLASGLTAPTRNEYFAGPHPAGTPGLHIHTLAPVSRNKTVWHIGYQDVAAVGQLFATGKLDVTRVVAVGGPVVTDPRLVRTRRGAALDDVVGKEGATTNTDESTDESDELRHISGSVLSGKKAMGDAFGYLGHYDNQVSVLREDREKEFVGWLMPGLKSFSVIPIYMSKLLGIKSFDMTTSTHGSPRAMVPVGLYERVMPLDILPTFLLRSLMVGDLERAEQLGALELDEEDLALCTFVCPGKTDYGPVLRRCLELIEKEG